jgi:methanogenic corrinoid protein MtbC1
MTVGLLRSPVPAPREQRVILACVAGNHHMLGLRMVSDAFQLDGWEVDFLGANVPTPDLVRHAAEHPAQLIGLSVSFPQQLHQVRLAIAALETRLGKQRPPVIIGGLAINRFGDMAAALGAEASASTASEALRRAASTVAP